MVKRWSLCIPLVCSPSVAPVTAVSPCKCVNSRLACLCARIFTCVCVCLFVDGLNGEEKNPSWWIKYCSLAHWPLVAKTFTTISGYFHLTPPSPTTISLSSIAKWNFTANHEHQLSLEVGDTVHIQLACDGRLLLGSSGLYVFIIRAKGRRSAADCQDKRLSSDDHCHVRSQVMFLPLDYTWWFSLTVYW